MVFIENDNILGYQIIRTHGDENIMDNIERMIDELLMLSDKLND